MRFLRRRRKPVPAPSAPEARRPLPAAPVALAPDLTELEDQARYHRDRVALYRARMHGSQPTSVGRLEELERASAAADERLRTARRVGHV
ncbi:hypothetical protein [Solirubrobacter soli]|uniref:hypothetical protein n=1 Tax=Solirubrobacter soli TaxID=363832 RepID=UPI0003FA170E|nr:hypothetical protein [Solirubrobacter soli]